MPLYVLELQNITNKDKKIFFDEEGNAYYGKNEDDLIFAEGLEISSGYKIPPHIYVKDLSNAFLLGMKVERDRNDF